MTNESNYWKDAYEGAAEEASFGTYGQAEALLGYFVYASGYTGNDRIEKCFFQPEKYGDASAREAAKKKAQAFSKANDDARVRWCHALRLFRVACVRADGKSVSEPTDFGNGWDSDQFDPVPLWTLRTDDPSMAKARMAAVEQFGVRPGVKFYGRFAKQNDPYKVHMGVQDGKDAQGKAAYKNFWNVIEVFESEKDMMQHVTLSTETATVSTAGDVPVPAAYGDLETWKSVWQEMYEAKKAGTKVSDLTGPYQATVAEITKALAAYIPM